MEAFEFAEAFLDFVAKVDEALGVVFKEGASIGEADGTSAADEKGLAERVFELANGEADGGLGAKEAFGGTREAAFLGDHQKDLKFREIHVGHPRAL